VFVRRLIVAFAVGASLIGAVAASSATRVNVTEREYEGRASEGRAPAGKVKFVVTNKGDLEHEPEVVKWGRDPGELPMKKNNAALDDDLEMGETKSFTVKLKRGKYVLLCNEAGHYELGQYRGFRVTK
jgi:uncharacterized cupredoxin-like copper-binding protein